MSLATARGIARRRVRLFGIEIDAVRMDQVVAQILIWINEGSRPCRYVVTPNVDHVVLYQECDELRQAYSQASLVLADGAPVVAASRLIGRRLPERVAGSDLVPCLFHEAAWQRMPLRVYLLGAAPGVGQQAAERMAAIWPRMEVVGVSSPPLGFERDVELNRDLVAEINACQPDLLLIGLGAPKQELWAHGHYQELAVPVALCIGATIDFLAGHRPRAPRWMRRAGLEWFYRVIREPRRLARRYARDAWHFPRLVWRELQSQP
ncbi:MAG TPA: WecB/TagA/CpsF family glycosyltransferase [Pirellulales bacterium]|nr:WecB/TagA/CpsF family glycosyltransferase [Pirellulales bacterium]